MELYFILFIIALIAIIFLIFKLIKKIFVAIFTVFMIITLIFAGVGALVYFDIKALSEKRDFDVNLIYGNLENPKFGVSLSIINSTVNQNDIKSANLDLITDKELKDKEGDFYIYISEKFFKELIKDDKNYTIEGFEEMDILGVGKISLSLNGNNIHEILESENSLETFTKIIYGNNKEIIPKEFENIALELLETTLEESFKVLNIQFEEMIFAAILANSIEDEMNTILFLKAYKTDEIQIYPDRLSFKILRILPSDFIAEQLNLSQ